MTCYGSHLAEHHDGGGGRGCRGVPWLCGRLLPQGPLLAFPATLVPLRLLCLLCSAGLRIHVQSPELGARTTTQPRTLEGSDLAPCPGSGYRAADPAAGQNPCLF